MRIYLAGPWVARKSLVSQAREELRAAGFTVDCRWIDFDETAADEGSENVLKLEAENDVEDILKSDALLVFNPGGTVSEGKAFEQGLAYARHMPIVVVGPYTCIFQRLADVKRVDTLAEAIDVLKRV